MKQAFTMIELAFVIVIIGILVSIALPKLAARRDDAKLSVLMTNSNICIKDAVGSYKGQGTIPVIGTIPACAAANMQKPGSISVSGNYIVVTGVHPLVDGNYIYKGTNVTF